MTPARTEEPPAPPRLARAVVLNTSLLTIGRIVVAASNLIGITVTTRYLGPERYGSLTIALVFIAVAVPLTDLGLYTIATRELAKRPQAASTVLRHVFGMGLVLSAIVTVATLAVVETVYSGASRFLVREAVAILAIQIVVAAPGASIAAILVARERFYPLVVGAFLSAAVLLCMLLAATTLDWGFSGLVAAYAAGAAAGSLAPLAFARETLTLRPAYDATEWREIATRAAPLGGVLVLGHIYLRADTFLISFLRSDAEVALYGVAYKVVELLMVFPALFVLTFFPVLSRLQPHDPDLNGIVAKATVALELVTVPLLVVLIGFADPVVSVIAGPGFGGAAGILRVLMVALGLIYFNTLYFGVLTAQGLQRRLFWILIGVLLCNVPINLILIPLWGARGAALAVVASELTALFLILRAYRRVGSLPRLRAPLRVLAAGSGVALAVLLILYASSAAHIPALAELAGGVPLAALLYVALLHLLHALPEDIALPLARVRGR